MRLFSFGGEITDAQKIEIFRARDAVFQQFEREIDAAEDEDICSIYKRFCREHKDIQFADYTAPESHLTKEMERRLYLAKLAYLKRKE